MTEILVSRNPLDPLSYERHEADSLCQFLYEYFDGERPETLALYAGEPSDINEITPRTETDVAALDDFEGPIYAIVMPADPGTALVVGAIIGSIAVGVGLALLAQPPNPTQRSNIQQPSPNNELGRRENVPRIGKRIEDIFGTVRSTPTLIAFPYSIYEDNIEKEIAYMCIGKGEYEVSDIRDGDTLISDIDGASVEIYEPDTSPNGGYPVQTIGSAIGREVINVERTAAVNGQVLQAPNVNQVIGDSDIKFTSPNSITTNNSNIDFSDLFSAGDSIIITNSAYTGTGGSYNFDGTYEVATASTASMTLVNPNAVNSDWSALGSGEPGGATNFFSPVLTSGESVAEGPFTVGDASSTGLFLNYVALNGLWKSDGENQTALTVNIRVTVSKAGESDEVFNQSVIGSVSKRETIGVTHYITPTFNGPYSVTIDRTTDTDREAGFTIQDEVKARDLYASAPVFDTDFGDVTTIFALTEATAGALAVKERRLNCLVTRKIPKRNANGTFTANQTDYNARDVLIFTARDDYIGNRTDDEIDFASIADAIDECVTYFGTEDGAAFNYTFDDDNLSFEETWRVIADAAFCEPYREGDLLKLNFEGATSTSRMLFNHRSTVPNSQKRTVRFGNALNYDGVEYEYVSPATDQVETLSLPAGVALVNPRRIESVGIRTFNQAWWHANRAWNKIQYQAETVEVEALEQANNLVRLDRVLCADNTRPDTSDGDVVGQSGLTLTLSQPHTFLSGFDYSIYLQYADGSVQSIPILAGSTDYEVVLQSSPSGTVITDDAKVQRTPYIIVGDTDQGISAFLVDEIDPVGGDENTVNLRLINYDARYYAEDGVEYSG